MFKIKKIYKSFKVFLYIFNKEQCFSQAATLAYTTLLALVPLLAVSFSIFSTLPIFNKLTELAEQFIFSNFVASSAQTVQQYLQTFVSQTQELPILGLLSLLVTAIILVFTIEQSFNKIWQLKKHRHSLLAFFLYWLVLTLLPILIGGSVFAVSYILALPILKHTLAQKIIASSIPYLATYIAFVLLYITLPNCKVPKKAAFSGAFIALILFEIAKKSFTLYITKFASYQLIYGALALVPIFLFWLYISWVIILCGVVISYVVSNYKHVEKR